ncbi:hypothetical protein C2G38_2257997 [Gigaspora rosea]|uniref:Uncharacterized protein n=1 Tax=Gigaspora rosea TaxID=44941 RepID=A0A397USX9_9GLOM|nr:hypothetical protein C2G38_2257997 [Gigaspora rosea]
MNTTTKSNMKVIRKSNMKATKNQIECDKKFGRKSGSPFQQPVFPKQAFSTVYFIAILLKIINKVFEILVILEFGIWDLGFGMTDKSQTIVSRDFANMYSLGRHLFPCIGLRSQGESIEVNFGSRKFKFEGKYFYLHGISVEKDKYKAFTQFEKYANLGLNHK